MTRTEEIMQAALNLFAEKGYDATSIQHITSAVNIKKATFYSHFLSKKELFVRIMEEQAKLIVDRTQETLDNSKATDLKGLLFDVFDSHIRGNFNRTHLLFWKRMLLNQGGDDTYLQDEINVIMYRVNDFMMSSISAAVKKVCGDISQKNRSCCMLMFLVFLQGYLDWIIITRKPDSDHIKHAWECFWTGLQSVIAK